MNGTVCLHPVPHGLVDGLVTGNVAQDVLVKDPLGPHLPLRLVVVLVETARKETGNKL